MKVRLFFTYSGSNIAKLAVWATGGPWGHVGIAFEHDDGWFDLFEARSGEGFVGPFTLQHARVYIAGRHGRFLISDPFDEISSEDAAAIHAKALSMVGTVSYSKWQLGVMFLYERYGFRMKPSPSKVVCSEAVAALLHPYLDVRDCNHELFDTVTPNSVYWRMCEIQAGYTAGEPRLTP